MKVVFHVNETNKWSSVISNANNILAYSKETGDEFVVEVIANGEAVIELSEKKAQYKGLYESLRELSDQDVRFFSCRNAMRKYSVDEKELYQFVTAVPAGVVALIQRQAEGYAYIKP